MRIYDLIAKKRDGGTHTREELEAIVNGFVSGEVADYQMAAWMMAVYLRGMTNEETAELTDVDVYKRQHNSQLAVVQVAIFLGQSSGHLDQLIGAVCQRHHQRGDAPAQGQLTLHLLCLLYTSRCV